MPSFLPAWFTLLICFSTLAGQPTVQPNNQTGPQKALYAAFEKGDLMVAISPVNWRPGLCLTAAQLAVGQTVSLRINLLARTDYVFIGSSANQSSDIDLILRDSTGTIVSTDVADDATPVLEYRPVTSGSYTLQVHLVAGAQQREFVALSLLRSGGRVVQEQEYIQVANSFFATANDIQVAYKNTFWQTKPGQWCLFGYSLAEGEGATLQQIQPGPGPHFFAATGSRNLKNIDLYLASEAHKIVAKDNGPNAFPLITYNFPPAATFDLRVEVERSRANALLLVGVFQQ